MEPRLTANTVIVSRGKKNWKIKQWIARL